MNETGVIFALIRDNKILMQQRDGNCKRYPFMWCIPGGTREAGETYEMTLAREIKEEYDISINSEQCHFLMDYHNGSSKVFVCDVTTSQEPVLGEGMAMEWMPLDAIEKLDLGFEQAGIIPALRAARPTL